MNLDVESLCKEAKLFSELESQHAESALWGVTDGKAVGTYLEAKFITYLRDKGYAFQLGNAASGLDFPQLGVDIKTTSVRQPQSSCPFRGLRQKIYGLGYSLIVFVYSKHDNAAQQTATLTITDTIFVEAQHTADFQMTQGLLSTLGSNGNAADLASFMQSRALTEDPNELERLAEEVMKNPPTQGYLTISPALQWRLNFGRAVELAGKVDGVVSVHTLR